MSLTGLKSRCQHCYVSSGGSKGESIFSPFPLSRSFLHSLTHGHSSIPSAKLAMSDQTFLIQHRSETFLFVPFIFKDPSDHVGSKQISHLKFNIISAKSLLSCEVIYLQRF